MTLMWKLAAGESSVTVMPPNNSVASAWVIRYVRSGGYPQVPTTAAMAQSNSGSNVTSVTPTSVATTADNATEISIVAEAVTTAITLSTQNGFRSRFTATNSQGFGLGVGDIFVPTSGSTPGAPTWSNSTAGNWIWASVAFHA